MIQQITDKNIWVYDIETISNCFTYTAINRDTYEIAKFVIWEKQNDLTELLDHLYNCKGQIGFNNIAFDANIIEFILTNANKFLKMKGEPISRRIYREAQFTIKKEWSNIRNPTIAQLDLFKIWHFDNKAKMTSLKKLEMAMGFENVQDMPHKYDVDIENENQVKEILDYNLNDVIATKKFYDKTVDKINLRKDLIKKYNIPCLNYSDSKIGEELVLNLYCAYTKQDVNSVKKRRTYRNNFKFNECIPSYIKFETKEFNELLDYLKSIEVTELKDSFHYEFEYNDCNFFLGTGGIHQSAKEGIYEADENTIIIDADVASLYPSLAVVNQIYPQHLGKEFCTVYEGVLKERIEAKNNGNKTISDGLKLSLNSVYGKSNSEYSWLYDSLYTLKTTLAGQLSLCMLAEMLYIEIPEMRILQTNTDGITVMISPEQKEVYLTVCKKWEEITKLSLEYADYSKMIMRDVSNYMAISTNGKVKRKGIFKLHDEMREDGEWQKAFNSEVVVTALSEYYLNNISPEESISNCRNIYSFCKSFSLRGNFTCETLDINDEGNEVNRTQEQKTVRYFISKNGKKFRKVGKPLKPKWNSSISHIGEEDYKLIYSLYNYITGKIDNAIINLEIENRQQANIIIECEGKLYTTLNKYYKYLSFIYQVSGVEIKKCNDFNIDCVMDWRIIDIESEGLVTVFNKYQELDFDQYQIDYDYYITECYKIINVINHETEKRREEEKIKKEEDKKEKQRLKYIEMCVNKPCTSRLYIELRKEWMDGIFPEITSFKKSPVRKNKELIEEMLIN